MSCFIKFRPWLTFTYVTNSSIVSLFLSFMMYWLIIMHNYCIVFAFFLPFGCVYVILECYHIDRWCLETQPRYTRWQDVLLPILPLRTSNTVMSSSNCAPSPNDLIVVWLVVKANWTLVVCVVNSYDMLYALICIHMHTTPIHFVFAYGRLFSCLT